MFTCILIIALATFSKAFYAPGLVPKDYSVNSYLVDNISNIKTLDDTYRIVYFDVEPRSLPEEQMLAPPIGSRNFKLTRKDSLLSLLTQSSILSLLSLGRNVWDTFKKLQSST